MAPQMFKSVAGRGHQEFSSNRQQVGLLYKQISAARPGTAGVEARAGGGRSQPCTAGVAARAGRQACWQVDDRLLPRSTPACPLSQPPVLPAFVPKQQTCCPCHAQPHCLTQDAEEYWGHLLQLLSRAEHAAGERLPGARDAPTARLFTYGTEDRIQCSETGRVRGTLWLAGCCAVRRCHWWWQGHAQCGKAGRVRGTPCACLLLLRGLSKQQGRGIRCLPC